MDDSVFNNIFLCSIDCPLGSYTNNCVFDVIRKIDNIERKIHFINSINGIEKMTLFLRHKECMLNRKRELKLQAVKGLKNETQKV